MVRGRGYNSGGKFKTSVGGKKTDLYTKWVNMFQRAYSGRQPSYAGVSVDERFYDFQAFCEWAETQKGFAADGWDLDKDLLASGHKVYSPDACVFLPNEVNNLLLDNAVNRGELPIGVCWHKAGKKYVAYLKVEGKLKHLGMFGSVESASEAYKSAKEANAQRLALKWKDSIDSRAYEALLRYKCQ